ncbi:MAG: hypothetical protein KDA91_01080 [Planctomycetaceae bacterium]|nr:hypothetical protein [Planctomycetaceae bacterium]
MQSDETSRNTDRSVSPYSPPSESSSTTTGTGPESTSLFHDRVRIVWAILCGVSIVVLLFYRSAPGHGPDMVGREMTAFLSPLLLALFVSFIYLVPTAAGHSRGKLLLYTVMLMVAELFLYGTVLMP